MATATDTTQLNELKEGPRIRLDGISWETYKRLADEVGERPSLRLTYSDGALEIMSISPEHDWLKGFIGRMIEMLCWELEIRSRSNGSFTHRRDDLQKALEPDECFWVQNAPVVGLKMDLDLRHDPPPDLAVEIDITSSSVSREGIYAALGTPELWQCDGRRIDCRELRPNGKYESRETSLAFPGLKVAELIQFLDLNDPRDELTRLKDFVAWLRTQNLNPEGTP